MDQIELLRTADEILDRLAIPYCVVGSMASMCYGETRFTNDLDLLIDLKAEDIARLCAEFPDPDYYVSEAAAREAVQRRRQFNVIHVKSGYKIDFMIVKLAAWNQQQLARRVPRQYAEGLNVHIASPEDVILGKLLYYREGESPKHLRDIAAMVQVSGDLIDRDDVTKWATELGVLEIWDAILTRLKDAETESA